MTVQDIEALQLATRNNFWPQFASPQPTMSMPMGFTRLSPEQEALFKLWASQYTQKAGLNPNVDDPRQHYDYRAAFLKGMIGQSDPSDIDPITRLPRIHGSSEFKMMGHPNRFVTIPGIPVLDTITNAPYGQIRYRPQ